MNIQFRTQMKGNFQMKTEVLDNSFDATESTSSKRFSRRNNVSRQQLNGRSSKLSQKFIRPGQKKYQDVSIQSKRNNNQNTGDMNVDLALRLIQTPIKLKYRMAPLSSDRATQSTYWLAGHQNEHVGTPSKNKIDLTRQNLSNLQTDLDLKINEVMILEDQNMKLKRQLALKESEFYQLTNRLSRQQQKLQEQHLQEMQKLKTQIKLLKQQQQIFKQQIKGKNAQLKQTKKTESNLVRQIKSLQLQKLMAEKHLEDVYKRKLPKDLRQIMSFREISLMNQVEEFKNIISKDKTHSQIHLQQQMRKIQQEYNEKVHQNNHLSVFNRILNKKICQNDIQFNEKCQQFKRCMNQLRYDNSELQEKMKVIRKQNMKMKRLNILSVTHVKKRRNSIAYSSSSESLSLQLSIN